MAYTSAIQMVEEGAASRIRLTDQLAGSSRNLAKALAASEPPGSVGFVRLEVG